MWSLVRPCVAVCQLQEEEEEEEWSDRIGGLGRPRLLPAGAFPIRWVLGGRAGPLELSPVCHRRWSRQAAILCLGRSTSEEGERRGREEKRRWGQGKVATSQVFHNSYTHKPQGQSFPTQNAMKFIWCKIYPKHFIWQNQRLDILKASLVRFVGVMGVYWRVGGDGWRDYWQ